MISKLATSMLVFLFTAGLAWTAHAGDACCAAAAAAADKAGVEKPAGEAVAPCQQEKCADCPDCAAGIPCAQAECEKCQHCAKGEACANCPGPDKCPHHDNCPNACTDCAKPEGGEAQ